jgi:hypothetical protein
MGFAIDWTGVWRYNPPNVMGAVLKTERSNEMNVWHHPTRDKMVRVLLMALTATLTTSQGMVLCFGCDGHVAIEPAGHDCCAGRDLTYGLQTGGLGLAPKPASGDIRCQSCIDVPMDHNVSNKPAPSRMSETRLAGSMVALVSLPTSDSEHATVAASATRSPADANSACLRTVVLQV